MMNDPCSRGATGLLSRVSDRLGGFYCLFMDSNANFISRLVTRIELNELEPFMTMQY